MMEGFKRMLFWNTRQEWSKKLKRLQKTSLSFSKFLLCNSIDITNECGFPKGDTYRVALSYVDILSSSIIK